MKLEKFISQELAINGGPKIIEAPQIHDDIFRWPIVTEEDKHAVLEVLRAGLMSGRDITKEFEKEYGIYNGTKYALGHCNGTASLQAAMWAVGLRRGDEMICPSITYWASALQTYSLGASVAFADIDPKTLCIDPDDIERHINERTKALMIVHYCGHPCDMDQIIPIVKRHNLKLLEDVSHAHGTLYKGKMAGTFGDVAAMSMMSGKSFPAGEAGMLITNNQQIYERAVGWGHYGRHDEIKSEELKKYTGLPFGGIKGRMCQWASAMGRVQLKHYPQRIEEIQKSLNYFWDLLEGTPGLRPHRPAEEKSTMGGWYNPLGKYVPEELGGLAIEKFIEAANAECGRVGRGINFPLHLHPVFNEIDVYGDGKPTRIAFTGEDIRQPKGSLPISEGIAAKVLGVPYFKKFVPEVIEQYAASYKKVALNANKLV